MEQLHERTVVEGRRLLAEHSELGRALAALLFRHDPIHISYEENCQEYAPEAARILARLGDCCTCDDACVVIYQELVRSFGAEAVGAMKDQEQLAGETWALWQGSA